jgi:Tol biopolymer transport system component
MDGVLNVWMAPAGDITAGEPKGRPINWQDWSADGRLLMFLNDETGDENHHLFVVDPVTHAMRDVTPLANISVQLTLWSLEA